MTDGILWQSQEVKLEQSFDDFVVVATHPFATFTSSNRVRIDFCGKSMLAGGLKYFADYVSSFLIGEWLNGARSSVR